MDNKRYYYDYTDQLSKVLAQAKDGKELTVGFLGGSITQGCTPSVPEKAYVVQTYHWLKEKMHPTPVNCINAGIGATGSLIGVHRVEEDLLAYKPDIIVVEFAANDVPPTNETRIAYESLIRKILTQCPQSAVVQLFMTLQDGTSAEAQQTQIGHHYGLPMVSFRQEVFNGIKKGDYKWEDIEVDEVHPNDKGHGIIAMLLQNLLHYAYEQEIDKVKTNTLVVPLFSDKYISSTILNTTNFKPLKKQGFTESEEGFKTLQYGWKSTGEDEIGIFECRIKAKNIFLLYTKGIEEERAVVDIQVGNKQLMLDSSFEGGWGNYAETCSLVEGDTVEEHLITIKKREDTQKGLFHLLGFLISL